jgi:hypothetical protein
LYIFHNVANMEWTIGVRQRGGHKDSARAHR